MQIELQSMAIQMPPLAYHPNRTPFRGVLTLVGVPSDKAPAGARGHRVVLTRKATEQALPSLLGMALDYAPALDRHDARRKVGVITEANLHDTREPGVGATRLNAAVTGPKAHTCQRQADMGHLRNGSAGLKAGAAPTATLQVSGYLFAKDFPEVVREMRAGGRQKLGMSYEIADARVAEMNAPVWEITEFTFTGAALLRRDKAAYRQTWIELE